MRSSKCTAAKHLFSVPPEEDKDALPEWSRGKRRRVRVTPQRKTEKSLESEKWQKERHSEKIEPEKEHNRATTCLLEKARQVKAYRPGAERTKQRHGLASLGVGAGSLNPGLNRHSQENSWQLGIFSYTLYTLFPIQKGPRIPPQPAS